MYTSVYACNTYLCMGSYRETVAYLQKFSIPYDIKEDIYKNILQQTEFIAVNNC